MMDVDNADILDEDYDILSNPLDYLETQPEFVEKRAQVEAQLAEDKAIQDARPSHKLPYRQPAQSLQNQLPFDLVAAIEQFLFELGIFEEHNQGQQAPLVNGAEDRTPYETWTDQVVTQDELALLLAVIPNDHKAKFGLSGDAFVGDDADLKTRLLDLLARLILHPALTFPIARCFEPIVIDLGARWLFALGFDSSGGATAAASTVSPRLIFDVLTACSRLLEACPALYPIFLILLRHPFFARSSLLGLLDEKVAEDELSPGSAQTIDHTEHPMSSLVQHQDLCALLLMLDMILKSVPYFSLMPAISQRNGSLLPPPGISDTMVSHPSIGMRMLAWRVMNLWIGWEGKTKAEMYAKYVYDVDKDASQEQAKVKQMVPFPGPTDREGFGEEWLQYWPRLAAHQPAQVQNGSLRICLDTPFIDSWIFEEDSDRLDVEAWQRRAFASSTRPPQNALLYTSSDLPPLLTDIEGVHLLREVCCSQPVQLRSAQETISPRPSTFVSTDTSRCALRDLAINVKTRTPVILKSPPAAGKASVLRQLHHLLWNSGAQFTMPELPLVTINLADRSLDAKTILGSLASSPTEPGSFVFIEGSLTRALRQGRWLVLQDIDKAAEDVLSTIAALVERMQFRGQEMVGGSWGGVAEHGVGVMAGDRWVPAAEGFMLFATIGQQHTATGDLQLPKKSTFFGCQFWNYVWMDAPSPSEIQQIAQESYPVLHKAIIQELVAAWTDVARVANSLASSSAAGTGRDVTVRDLLRWCHRVTLHLPSNIAITSVTANPTFQDELFIEAADIFLAPFPYTPASSQTPPTKYLGVSEALRRGLHLSEERSHWLLSGRVPELLDDGLKTTDMFQVGRARVDKARHLRKPESSTRPYALTKPFLLLLERLAVCVQANEPVLLVGETGTGKTAAVGYLAEKLSRKLVALNLSNQTEATDLLGGFKPVNQAEVIKRQALRLVNHFVDLFSRTFDSSRNADYVIAIRKAYNKQRWGRLASLFREAARPAMSKASRNRDADATDAQAVSRKKRKIAQSHLYDDWQVFVADVEDFDIQHNEQIAKQAKLSFTFVEGPLVKALQNGDWILLDEINLATAETLEALSTLMQNSQSSLVLTERGDLEPIRRHADFRLFACMNPATDVGKRDLPPSLRMKFSEFCVPPPDTDIDVLLSIVSGYVGHAAVGDKSVLMDTAELYLGIKALSRDGRLADGSNQPPHFSMRTLARSLTFAADVSDIFGLRRALYEGFTLSFSTLLEPQSHSLLQNLLNVYLVQRSRNARTFLSTVYSHPPNSAKVAVQLGSFWLPTGPLPIPEHDDYVLTESVQVKLVSLARTVAAARFPVLIQGPTSAGKTSIIEFLARRTGHRFVRINNHEHTDIQEYLGTYVSDPLTGQLVFREGLLVKAIRNGEWLVLDELNLAPTDVLEALNRLLDDNRELVSPETHEVIKPHAHFMLFATQNPPGLYGGRKVLSRAFRNRFLEMHFSDVPQNELEIILCQRCAIAPSYAKKIVQVFLELQKRRQSSRVFEERHAFVTLRDLFRWGTREAVGYEQLAANGYMLLAERARRQQDKIIVKDVIEQVMKVDINESALYRTAFDKYISEGKVSDLVWTSAMRRLYVLMRSALEQNEPVLLVGETGSGKTSLCQTVAEHMGRFLHVLNCHQNTETADLLGGQRPVRQRGALQSALAREARHIIDAQPSEQAGVSDSFDDLLPLVAELAPTQPKAAELLPRMQAATALFAWHDGPLLQAMKNGSHILLDEISLADDSVLERLNSILEPSRTLTLAENGALSASSDALVANASFQIVATMNPGGDFGKKELSPALRNRFTEIWVPWVSDHQDLLAILRAKLRDPALEIWAERMLEFSEWYTSAILPTTRSNSDTAVTLRDLLAWAAFMTTAEMEHPAAFVHGAIMTLLDGIGSTPATAALSKAAKNDISARGIAKLLDMSLNPDSTVEEMGLRPSTYTIENECIRIEPFKLSYGHLENYADSSYSLAAPTVLHNAQRVLRVLQLNKPVMLEGPPGVGKTSLVTTLAGLSKHRLHRINLSDQTDLVDLFGSDLPVEGGQSGEFAWRNGIFLTALENGDWVLLDEMNLASQSVLEGLNSCLDHRGTVYIPELDRSFFRHPTFRIFAAQNPLGQGGGRKGLPRSFLDRFSQVYMSSLEIQDYEIICTNIFPQLSSAVRSQMIAFSLSLDDALTKNPPAVGREGSPWEINLRDVLRWMTRTTQSSSLARYPLSPQEYIDDLFIQRFRNERDRCFVIDQYKMINFEEPDLYHVAEARRGAVRYRIGRTHAKIQETPFMRALDYIKDSDLPDRLLRSMHSLAAALHSSSLVVLTGPRESGKSRLLRAYSRLSGQRLRIVHTNTLTDTMDLLGSFEQANAVTVLTSALKQIDLHIAALLSSDRHDWNLYRQYSNLIGLCRRNLEAGLSPGDVIIDIQSILLNMQEDKLLDTNMVQWVDKCCRNATQPGRFRWKDGPLVEAMLEGDLFVIQDANLCNAAVLDRLNALFEDGGSLHIPERGTNAATPTAVQAHPAFRVVMTLDPVYGELSRAMRNRGVEIAMLYPHTSERAAFDDGTFPHPTSGSLQTRVLSRLASRKSSNIDVSDAWTVSHTSQLIACLNFSYLGAMARQLRRHSIGPNLLFALSNHDLTARAFASREDVFRDDPRATSQSLVISMDDNTARKAVSRSDRTSRHARDVAMRVLIANGALQNTTHAQAIVNHGSHRGQGLSVLQRISFSQVASMSSPLSVDREASMYDVCRALPTAMSFLASECQSQPETASVILDLHSMYLSLLHLGAAQSLDFASFQAIIKELLQAISVLKIGKADPLEKLLNSVSSADKSLDLSTGHALQAIWKAALVPRSNNSTIEQIQQLASRIEVDGVSSDLVLLYAELVANSQLQPIGRDQQLDDVLTCFVKKLLPYQMASGVSVESPENGGRGLLQYSETMTLAALSSRIRQSSTFGMFVRCACALGGRRLNTIALPTSEDLRPAIRSYVQWALFGCRTNARVQERDQLADGTNRVYGATLLTDIYSDCRGKPPTLSSRRSWQENLGKKLPVHIDLAAGQVFPHDVALTWVLVGLIQEVLTAAGVINDSEYPSELPDKLGQLRRSLESMERCSPAHTLATVIQNLAQSDRSTTHRNLDKLASAFFAFAAWLWQIYMPDYPLDPIMTSRARGHALVVERSSLFRNAVSTSVAVVHPKTTGTTELHYIAHRLRKLNTSMLSLEASDSNRSHDSATFNALHAELAHCGRDLLRWEETWKLFDESAACSNSSVVLGNLQISIDTAWQRLWRLYRQYEDFLSPLSLAFRALDIAIGIRLFSGTRNSGGPGLEADETLLQTLTIYPSCAAKAAVLELQSTTISGTRGSSVQTLYKYLIQLKAFPSAATSQHRHNSQDLVRRILCLYQELYEAWSADRREAEDTEEQKKSLYRTRTTHVDVLSDDVLDEQEIASLFPTYSEGSIEGMKKLPPIENTTASSSIALDVYKTHLALFESTESTEFNSARERIIASILSHWANELSSQCDERSRVYRLHRLAQISSGVEHITGNFYTDANFAKMEPLLPILSKLNARVAQILDEWPEQVVLINVLDKIGTLLSLNTDAPLMRVLTLVESLLPLIEEWQRYASRETTLASEKDALVALVVEWRRLELLSWNGLLARESRVHAESIAEWWYRLYEILVHAPSRIVEMASQTEWTTYLSEVVESLEAFLLESNCGDVAGRLALLLTFSRLVDGSSMLYAQGSRTRFANLAAIIANVHDYYTSRTLRSQTILFENRQERDKEVREIIRLASWKDVNVYALQASARKSHGQLYKILRRHRKSLRRPAIETGVPQGVQSGVAHLRDTHNELSWPPLPLVIPQQLGQIPTGQSDGSNPTVNALAFKARVEAYVSSCEARPDSSNLKELTDSIRQRVHELGQMVIVGKTKEAQQKHASAILSLKKRAWAEFAKDFRRIGCSSRPIPSTLKIQEDSARLFSTAPFIDTTDALLSLSLRRVKEDFFYVVANMPRLRQRLADHHEDIGTDQLRRAIGSLQSCFGIAIQDKQVLGYTLLEYSSLQEINKQLQWISTKGGLARLQPEHGCRYLAAWIAVLRNAQTALTEMRDAADTHARHTPQADDKYATDAITTAYESFTGKLTLVLESLESSPALTHSSGPLSQHDEEAVKSAILFFQEVILSLERENHHFPRLQYVVQPVLDWMHEAVAATDSLNASETDNEALSAESYSRAVENYNQLIKSLMVIIQQLITLRSATPSSVSSTLDDDCVPAYSKELRSRVLHFHLAGVRTKLSETADSIAMAARNGCDMGAANDLIAHIAPFLQAYSNMLCQSIREYARWSAAVLSLCKTVQSVILTVADQGFCRPSDSQTQSQQATQDADGTGIGSGEGGKNVSKDITDESQVEGVQGDQDDQDEDNTDRKSDPNDDAVDMSEDFGGRTEDMAEPDGTDGEADEEDQDTDSNGDVDEELGKVDPLDPNAVDEKFWQGDGDEAEDKKQDEAEEQTTKKTEGGPTEMGQRDENRQNNQQNDGPSEDEHDMADTQASSMDDIELKQETDTNESPVNEPSPSTMLPDMDNDAAPLELPEELKLDDWNPGDDDGADDDDDIDRELEKTVDADSSDGYPDGDDRNSPAGEDADMQDADDRNTVDEKESGPQAPAESAALIDDQPENTNAEETGAGTHSGHMHSEFTLPALDAAPGKPAERDQKEQDVSQRTSAGDVLTDENIRDSDATDTSGRPDEVSRPAEDSDFDESSANRQIGDRTKSWLRRIEAIPDASKSDAQRNNDEDMNDKDMGSDIEYINEALEETQIQAAGPAESERQAAAECTDSDVILDYPDDENMPENMMDSTIGPPLQNTLLHGDLGVPEGDLPAAEAFHAGRLEDSEVAVPPATEMDGSTDNLAIDELDELPYKLDHWLASGRTSLPGAEVWRLYESITRDLSLALTEALRLVLAPTLATRLQGDYRTGKRLNMRKIIPYIASDFTKDKIWLRRTRPSRREYQIVLALDDSRSMADSSSVHLAFQTLALVCQSLSRLEVGEVSVCRFGERVDFVLDFENNLSSEETGRQIIDSFKFGQKSTDVRLLLQQSLEKLKAAREQSRSSAVDLWQLQIIISDGMCQNLDDIRALLRQAKDQKVMVVFLVVDSLKRAQDMANNRTSTNESIMTMQTVSYLQNAGGSMEIKMERYMDSFPFEYYVVLRDVQALPAILSDTLRQFFERVAAQ